MVEARLRSRRRWFVSLLLVRWLGLGLFVVAELPFLLDHEGWLQKSTARTGLAYLSAVAAACFLLRVFYLGDRASKITTRRRRDAPGFWRRKREDIAINFFFFVLGLAAGTLLAH